MMLHLARKLRAASLIVPLILTPVSAEEIGGFHLHLSVPGGRYRVSVRKSGSDLGVQGVGLHAACYLDPCTITML